MVSMKDVESRFGRSYQAMRLLNRWSNNRSRKRVAMVMRDHVSRYANSIPSSEVVRICRDIAKAPSLHALGVLQKSVSCEPVVRDWRPDFAFTHVFHIVLEAESRLLHFNDVVRHERFKEIIWTEAIAIVDAAKRRSADEAEIGRIRSSIRWRIGLAYYAHLKELYAVSVLRESGFSALMHPVADALFRTDFWIGDTNLDLYLPNSAFRSSDGRTGRKPRSADILEDASPQFQNVELVCPTVKSFGVVRLPERVELVRQVRSAVRFS